MAVPFRMYPRCDVPAQYRNPPSPEVLAESASILQCEPHEVEMHPVLLVPAIDAAEQYWTWHHSQPLERQMEGCIVSLVSLKTFAERTEMGQDDAALRKAESTWVEELRAHGCPQRFYLMSCRTSEVAHLHRDEDP